MSILNSFLDFDSRYFLEINGFAITWYAFCILVGIILAVYLGLKEAKRFGISANYIIDGVLICVPLAIIGARIYYIMFAFEEFYVAGSPIDTIKNMLGITDGGLQGLSITGGVIVAVIFVLIYGKKRKLNPLIIFDFLAPGLLIGQICGRWGNFFNQEAYGGIISEATFNWLQYLIPPFIMDKMYILGAYRHPTFLYESLWNLVGLIIILVCRRKSKKVQIGDGICFYLFWYGIGRSCLIEPFRTDALMLGNLRINIIVPALFAVIGLTWFILKRFKYRSPYYIAVQEEYKAKKIDTVICRIDGVLVDTRNLMKNAIYYAQLETKNINLTEDLLEEAVEMAPEEYFKENPEGLKYYLNYFDSHLQQLVIRQRPKEFFMHLFKFDYNVAVYSKYSISFIEYALELLKIRKYISVIFDECNDVNTIANAFPKAKNVLFISDAKSDLEMAKNMNYETCSVTYSLEYDEVVELGVTHLINKFSEMDNFIID